MNEQTVKTHEMASRDEAATRPERTQDRPTATAPVDIYESQDEILLVADVPGVAREDVHVDLEKNQLTLTARRTRQAAGVSREDFQEWDYFRSFMVPHGIDGERITAELNHGVLRVHLPKSAAVKPRRIEVKAG